GAGAYESIDTLSPSFSDGPYNTQAWSNTSTHKHHHCNDAQGDYERDHPLTPRGVSVEKVYLLSNGGNQGQRQEPTSPTILPVVFPHRHQTNPEECSNGRCHLRHVVLVEEACYTEED